ncbi:phenylacetate-CoA oxygenase subunit PaaJ [Duganella sp. FT80W]|uniref:Phenylacetate-CoA oxygenase subunit PaaJ n=1 Tax=Duganella guangzhouensis TaxID=2666084 RepID=A0A6I2LCH6_9BURK|nr:1,2-phenylacetyl-CoA epoxidase subunit PaaD [Duganella guangzhouensis]MRW94847.1 phenylacetate-CoA oxygenase subunit PaaJ [Duganella guangzhouensis]
MTATVATATAVAPAKAGAHAEQIWTWLRTVPDPEIPVISIVDLGIVREICVADDSTCDITITPTYSGCPAMQVIADAITAALHAHGIVQVRLHKQLSPAWTTDWMSAAAKAALRDYGIAPPAHQVIDISRLHRPATVDRHLAHAAAEREAHPAADRAATARAAISRRATVATPHIACPLCGSTHTTLVSQFGSTPCKALYQCQTCREPFDYFKPH